MSVKERQKIPRLRLPRLSRRAAKLFRTKLSVLKRIGILRKKLQPIKIINKSSLKGASAKHGFVLRRPGNTRYIIRVDYSIVGINVALTLTIINQNLPCSLRKPLLTRNSAHLFTFIFSGTGKGKRSSGFLEEQGQP